jgi:hypothetical protein
VPGANAIFKKFNVDILDILAIALKLIGSYDQNHNAYNWYRYNSLDGISDTCFKELVQPLACPLGAPISPNVARGSPIDIPLK